jgi:hypothetical protein
MTIIWYNHIKDVMADGGNSMIKAKKKRATRSAVGLSTLDGFLRDQGKLEDFEATAIKEVLAWQIAEAMKANKYFQEGLGRAHEDEPQPN